MQQMLRKSNAGPAAVSGQALQVYRGCLDRHGCHGQTACVHAVQTRVGSADSGGSATRRIRMRAPFWPTPLSRPKFRYSLQMAQNCPSLPILWCKPVIVTVFKNLHRRWSKRRSTAQAFAAGFAAISFTSVEPMEMERTDHALGSQSRTSSRPKES